VERSGDITIITFTHDAIRDVENVLARELEGLTAGAGERHLLLDFTHVEYLNSLELGTLINLHKQAEAHGGRLTLFNLSAHVFELFTVTRLDTLLGICREGAVAGSDLPPRRACRTGPSRTDPS
jgi:anti-anti-sigma factor